MRQHWLDAATTVFCDGLKFNLNWGGKFYNQKGIITQFCTETPIQPNFALNCASLPATQKTSTYAPTTLPPIKKENIHSFSLPPHRTSHWGANDNFSRHLPQPWCTTMNTLPDDATRADPAHASRQCPKCRRGSYADLKCRSFKAYFSQCKGNKHKDREREETADNGTPESAGGQLSDKEPIYCVDRDTIRRPEYLSRLTHLAHPTLENRDNYADEPFDFNLSVLHTPLCSPSSDSLSKYP